ncbi:MAG: hypothetical protein ABW175_01790 [Bradyrhizobium sp.]
MALLLASVIGVAALSFQARPDAEIVAVAFPAWWDAQRTLSAAATANAAIIRITAVPSLLVVRPDGREGLSRLYAAGAWFTLDPQAVAACFGPPNEIAK